MRTRHATSLVAALVSLTVALGCDGRRETPLTPSRAPGDARVTIGLTTPNAGDGAMLFTITGPSILDVTVRPGLEMDERRTTTNGLTTSTILLRGDLTSGALGEITVSARDVGAEYATEVRQVAAGAAGGYALRTNLSAYRLTIGR